MTPNIPTRDEIAESQRICEAENSTESCENPLLVIVDFLNHARFRLPLRNAQVLDLLDRLERLQKKCELQERLIDAMRRQHNARSLGDRCHYKIEGQNAGALRAELAALEGDGE